MNPFTLTELFGWYIPMPADGAQWETPQPCSLCGCAVFRPNTHQDWHNKVADLPAIEPPC